MKYVFKQGKWFHYKRFIPKRFKPFYDKKFIKASLKTDSQSVALQRANILNNEVEKIWLQLGKDSGTDHSQMYDHAVQLAQTDGMAYQPASEIAKETLEQIITRLMQAQSGSPASEPENISTFLGGTDKPSFPISLALQEFLDFEKMNLLNKSDNQIRKWENPRRKAIHNFIAIIGDLDINTINRKHTLAFRTWWHNRITEENLTANSANKDFSYLGQVLAFTRDNRNLGLDVRALMSSLRFSELRGTRPPFERDYIQNVLLNFDNLEGLNEECQLLLFAMADTGARLSELVGLNASKGDIQLNAKIPYIDIRPEADKALKTPQSARTIPLAGSALYAFKRLPLGFTRYYRRADSISANLNKYLRDNNLLPTEKHSVYSLRHSFEDRLTAIEIPEKIQAELMGHKFSRTKYGAGASLEQKQKWLKRICFQID